MIVISAVIGMAVVVAVLAPFFIGKGGLLAPGSQINAPERLTSMQEAILARYLDDEAAVARGDLSAGEWKKRQSFLVNRYIDVSRRLDFVSAGQEGSASDSRGAP